MQLKRIVSNHDMISLIIGSRGDDVKSFLYRYIKENDSTGINLNELDLCKTMAVSEHGLLWLMKP